MPFRRRFRRFKRRRVPVIRHSGRDRKSFFKYHLRSNVINLPVAVIGGASYPPLKDGLTYVPPSAPLSYRGIIDVPERIDVVTSATDWQQSHYFYYSMDVSRFIWMTLPLDMLHGGREMKITRLWHSITNLPAEGLIDHHGTAVGPPSMVYKPMNLKISYICLSGREDPYHWMDPKLFYADPRRRSILLRPGRRVVFKLTMKLWDYWEQTQTTFTAATRRTFIEHFPMKSHSIAGRWIPGQMIRTVNYNSSGVYQAPAAGDVAAGGATCWRFMTTPIIIAIEDMQFSFASPAGDDGADIVTAAGESTTYRTAARVMRNQGCTVLIRGWTQTNIGVDALVPMTDDNVGQTQFTQSTFAETYQSPYVEGVVPATASKCPPTDVHRLYCTSELQESIGPSAIAPDLPGAQVL